MLNQTDMRRLDRGFLVISLIWILMLAPLVAYIVIATVVGEGGLAGDDESDEVFDLVKYILYGVGAAVLAAVYFARRAMRNPHSLISRLSFYSFLLGFPYVLPAGQGVFRSPILHYASGILNCTALCQSIAIYGLIIFILDGSIIQLYSLVAISAVASVYCRPRKQELIDMAVQLKQG